MAFRRPSASTVSPVNPYASYPPNAQNQPSQPSTVPPMQDDSAKRVDPAAHPAPTDQFINDQDANDSAADDDEDEEKPKSEKKTGRRKIKIEFIQDKSRRHITFSKRKAGIMKKAYELSTLTGTQVLLLVVSETGLVYTFTTAKLQPLVTQPEGKNLIQACLNAPHGTLPSSMPVGQPIGRSSGPMGGPGGPPVSSNMPGGLSISGGPSAASSKDDEEPNDDDDARPSAGTPTSTTRTAPSPHANAPPPLSIPSGSPTSPQQSHAPSATSPGQYSAGGTYHHPQGHDGAQMHYPGYNSATGYSYPQGTPTPTAQGASGGQQQLGGLVAAAAHQQHWPPNAQGQGQVPGGGYNRR